VKTIDWTADEDERVKLVGAIGNTITYSASRVLVGHCPDCAAVLVVFNDNESWPLVGCSCGWTGDTLSIAHRVRYERGTRDWADDA
jgi:hypothetical protein